MSSYIQTTAEFKSVVDGDIVGQASLDATYDGKKAEIKSYSAPSLFALLYRCS